MARYKPYQTRGRFYVERLDEGWNVVDDLDAYCVNTTTKREAEDLATFARQYVKQHGDIDFGSFPHSLDPPLSYTTGKTRDWNNDRGYTLDEEEAETD
jgi:hypothetical protein